jgi:hypothetical protein
VSGPTEPESAETLSERDLRVADETIVRSEALATAAEAETTRDRDAADRSWIARWIIGIFAVSVGAVDVILVLQGLLTKEWAQVALQAADLIKTSVLPVVTLVLGFYFGSRAGKG